MTGGSPHKGPVIRKRSTCHELAVRFAASVCETVSGVSLLRIHEWQIYLEIVNVPSHRKALTKLLTSSHRLRCETGRWERPVVPYENRMCLVCLDKIGDEFHFLLECPKHQSLRSRLIGRYYWNRPSMLKLQQLLNSTCTNVIRAVAKFVYKAFNDLWFYVIHVCRFCTFWYPVAILCNCVRHADQMFLSRMTFVRARGPKTIIKSLNPWIHEQCHHPRTGVQ